MYEPLVLILGLLYCPSILKQEAVVLVILETLKV